MNIRLARRTLNVAARLGRRSLSARFIARNPVMSRRAFLRLGATTAAQAAGLRLATRRAEGAIYTQHGRELLRAATHARHRRLGRIGLSMLAQVVGAAGG